MKQRYWILCYGKQGWVLKSVAVVFAERQQIRMRSLLKFWIYYTVFIQT